jgi:hypothetical protein
MALASYLTPALPAQDARPTNEDTSWFEKSYVDAGSYMEGETAISKFHFKNPHGERHYIQQMVPNCQCSKALVKIGDRRFVVEDEPVKGAMFELLDTDGEEVKKRVDQIPIEPGQEGFVQVYIDLRGVKGVKEAAVMVRTSDKAAPVSNLRTRARSMQFFNVLPQEVNLNKMNWQDKREFTCKVSSSVQEDFEITGFEPLPESMAIEYQKEMQGGKALWTIKGTYGPGANHRSSGGEIVLNTNIEGKQIKVRVIAFVEGPLRITPGSFIPFGLIRKGKGASKEILIEPTNDFDLACEGVEITGLSVSEEFVNVRQERVDKALKIVIEISPDAPRKLIRGDLLVKLNHPAAKKQEFQFNGFVR